MDRRAASSSKRRGARNAKGRCQAFIDILYHTLWLFSSRLYRMAPVTVYDRGGEKRRVAHEMHQRHEKQGAAPLGLTRPVHEIRRCVGKPDIYSMSWDTSIQNFP